MKSLGNHSNSAGEREYMTIDFKEPNPSAHPRKQREEVSTIQPSILVVEDEEGVRDLLVQLLEMGGFSAMAVDNGLDALSSFKKDHYDMVFTDFRMPGMSGAEVTRAIKACSSQTPVVVVTGWDPEIFKEELACAGVDHIIQKPFDMDDVLEVAASFTAH